MSFRGWGNGFAVGGLLLAAGIAVAQAPEANLRFWVSLSIAIGLALLAIVLLRPRVDDREAQRVAYLRSQTTDRDIAFLLAGSRAITFPQTLSEHAAALAPLGERWSVESEELATARARKLIQLGLMEARGSSEVETSILGRAVVAFDQALKARRKAASEG